MKALINPGGVCVVSKVVKMSLYIILSAALIVTPIPMDAHSETVAFTGRVVDSDGKLIKGVTVYYLDGTCPYPSATTTDTVLDPLKKNNFEIASSDSAGAHYLYIQTPMHTNTSGQPGVSSGGFLAAPATYQGRVYFKPAGVTNVTICLPRAATFVIKATDAGGALMSADAMKTYGDFNGQYIQVTDLDDQTVPAVVWNCAASADGTTIVSAPAITVEVNAETAARKYAFNVLFWDTNGYGKLCLRADNPDADNVAQGFSLPVDDGQGFMLSVIDLNAELAKTAIANLARRIPYFTTHGQTAFEGRDLAALVTYLKSLKNDAALREALRARDELEFAAAKNAFQDKSGMVQVTVADQDGRAVSGKAVTIKNIDYKFLFGVFAANPGGNDIYYYSGYDTVGTPPFQKTYTGSSELRYAVNKKLFDDGFDLAVVFFGWKGTVEDDTWTAQYNKAYGLSHTPLYRYGSGYLMDKEVLNDIFGFTNKGRVTADGTTLRPGLLDIGYKLKVHATDYLNPICVNIPYVVNNDNEVVPIVRDGVTNVANAKQYLFEHQKELLADFKDSTVIWEAMNEPSYTNFFNLPYDSSSASVGAFMQQSAADIKEAKEDLPTLVNSAHEWDFGSKYNIFLLDGSGNDTNTPQSASTTFLDFLTQEKAKGALDQVDIVGIQFYPGLRLGDTMNSGLNIDPDATAVPAMTPSWLIDTVDRYASKIGKRVHITELSVPSMYGDTWRSGYWREKWTETTQADYLERIYAVMYAHPSVDSIVYWDVLESTEFIKGGSLAKADSYGAVTYRPAYNRISSLLNSVKGPRTISGITNSQGVFAARLPAGTYEVTIDGTTTQCTVSAGEVTPVGTMSKIVSAVYTISASAGAGGSISPSGAQSIVSGKGQTFTITPDNGCAIGDVLVDGMSVGKVTSYSFSGVVANHTIAATFTAANRAPSLTAIGSKSVNENATLSFTLSAADPDSDALTYSASGLPSGAAFNAATKVFNWTPTYDQAGVYAVAFSVSDGKGGTAQEAVSITVNNVNRAPTATNTSTYKVKKGKSISIALTGADSDNNALTYVITQNPSSGTISGTPPNLTYKAPSSVSFFGATYYIKYKVYDGTAYSSVATITIKVSYL